MDHAARADLPPAAPRILGLQLGILSYELAGRRKQGAVMDTDIMHEFIELAKTRNFTKCASSLNMVQSALSKHIKKAEAELGVQLIDRSPNSVRLTAAGEAFLIAASSIIATYDEFVAQCEKPNAFGGEERLMVQILQHARNAEKNILEAVTTFKEAYPQLVVQIRESHTYDTLSMIEEGLVDCGFFGPRIKEPPSAEGVSFVPLIDEEFFAWVSKGSALDKEPIEPADLEDATVPVWSGMGGNGLEVAYDEIFEKFGIRVAYSARYCNSTDDFFLNCVNGDDVVLIAEGSDGIPALSLRSDRVLRAFAEPLMLTTYMAFRESSPDENDALGAFRHHVLARYEASREKR